MASDEIPRGFTVTTSEVGFCTIRYRTSGMGDLGCFITIWMVGWTLGCILVVRKLFFVPNGFDNGLLVGAIWLWVGEVIVGYHFARYFWSVTVITLETDNLVIEKRFLKVRRWVVRREDVRAVRQIKDGGQDEDSFHSWGLVVATDAEKPITVLFRQRYAKSVWLGPIIARWAGVAYEALPEPPESMR